MSLLKEIKVVVVTCEVLHPQPAVPRANISNSDLKETFVFTPNCKKEERWREMLHQEETPEDVCVAELKQNSSGCPKLGVSGLQESHHHAPAPFANPCSGAVGPHPTSHLGARVSPHPPPRRGHFFPMEEPIPAWRTEISLKKGFFFYFFPLPPGQDFALGASLVEDGGRTPGSSRHRKAWSSSPAG